MNPHAVPLEADEARQLASDMGLSSLELDTIHEGLGRNPTRTEIAIFAGMWSEHCSYKSTLPWLKTLPKGEDRAYILAGPGSHAGTIALDETWALSFKIESHNHPSAVEPYQGAATGVGGILRDIIAQGARPTLVMDSLCFGLPTEGRVRFLRDGVTAGIAGYGNAIGIPNLGGRTFYDPRFEKNPLVNALAAGVVKRGEMRSAEAKGLGNRLLYVGAATGRDGILGAAFASEDLDTEASADDRPHVQVGDPYTGKKLMEAVLSFGSHLGMVAGQDMGASGITCASVEMAAAGGIGLDVQLDKIPLRDPTMRPEEIMLSESQERFMFIAEAAHISAAVEHFRRYGVEAVDCGEVVEGKSARVFHGDALVAEVDAHLVAEGAPMADWPVDETPIASIPIPYFEQGDIRSLGLRLIAHPNLHSHAAVYERYDQTVGNRSVRGPGHADAAVMRLYPPGGDNELGYAISLVSRPDLCGAHARKGTLASLAEAHRRLACVGASMLAITDGLNVASPQNPVENRKLREVIEGLGEGLRALDVPVTGGNCSLYNQSSAGPIPPAPMIGAAGLAPNVGAVPSHRNSEAGLTCILLGQAGCEPVAGLYPNLVEEDFDLGEPDVDLEAEKILAGVLVGLVGEGLVRDARSLNMGGLFAALAKLCVGAGVGAELDFPHAPRIDWALFGEYAARALVMVESTHVATIHDRAKAAGLACSTLGELGGNELSLTWNDEEATSFSWPLADLQGAYYGEYGEHRS